MDKNQIRRTMRNQRRQLSPSRQYTASLQLQQQLLRVSELRRAQHIAGYWPNDGEISLLPYLQTMQAQGRQLYLPQVRKNRQMHFKRFHLQRAMRSNAYGIPEPVSRGVYVPHQLDIVLLPLVAFDSAGHRLGMGGGYYDRCFAFLLKQPWRKKPVLFGIAHEFQQLEELPADAWDVPVKAIITNKGIIRV